MTERIETLPVTAAKLTVELGCVGCVNRVCLDVTLKPEEVFDAITAQTPHIVNEPGRREWRKGGGDSCTAVRNGQADCNNQRSIAESTSRLEQAASTQHLIDAL